MGNQQFMLSNYSSASQLRDRLGFVEDKIWGQGQSMHSNMQQVIMMQSKFPVIVREAIDDAKGLTPEQFFNTMDEAMKRMIGSFGIFDPDPAEIINENKRVGLDHNVDTEEEVEYAIRVFPNVLPTTFSSWRPRNFKELPFFPLVTELTVERTGPCELYHIFWAFEAFYHQIENHDLGRTDEDICLQLNEVFHSFLVRLKANCLASIFYLEIYKWANRLVETPYRIHQKTFRLLLDWKPTIFEDFRCYFFGINCPFLHYFLQSRLMIPPLYYSYVGNDDLWMRFQPILEGGMSHYPSELGFLCHKSFENRLHPRVNEITGRLFGRGKPFKVACDAFGKERVIKLMDKNILRITKARSYAIRALFVLVASNPKIDVDGIYFILRLDPTALVSATYNQSDLDSPSLLVTLFRACC